MGNNWIYHSKVGKVGIGRESIKGHYEQLNNVMNNIWYPINMCY